MGDGSRAASGGHDAGSTGGQPRSAAGGPRHLAPAPGRPPLRSRMRGRRTARRERRVTRRDRRADRRPASRVRTLLRRTLAWALVVPLAVWLVVRVTEIGAGTWVETVVVATPFAAAGSVVVLAVVAGLRVWPAIAAAAGVCVGFGLVVAPLFVPGPHPSPAPTGPGLTVMTVNVQFGHADPERVVELVERHDVAVLGVQELTHDFDEAMRTAGLDDLLPYGVVEARPGSSGTGVYSRFRVREVDTGIAGWNESPTGVITVPDAAPLQVSVVHPVPPIGAGARAAWRETFRTLPRPGDPPAGADGGGDVSDDAGNDDRTLLLIGDFNATVDQPTMRDLLGDGYVDAAGAVGRGWAMTWRFPRTPPLAIDHVLVDRRTRVRSVTVHGVAGSDHRAVVAELQVPAV